MKLIPAIVRDARSGAILTLAYMSEESLQRTRETGQTWFWSRSRNELWHKGATSGNTQDVLHIASDCDGDALVVSVIPKGPACHTGRQSCFAELPLPVLQQLERTLLQRRESLPAHSYSASLFRKGRNAIAQKVTEEAGEVVVAALGGEGRERVISEGADLVFHLMLMLVQEGIPWSAVEEELQRRSR